MMVKVAEGENAWITDSGKIYLCKVIKATNSGKLKKFFIHFMGWAPKYDCWTDEQNLAHEHDSVGKLRLEKAIGGVIATATTTARKKKGTGDAKSDDITVEVVAEDTITSSSTSSSIKRKVLTDEDQIAAKKRRRVLAEQDLIDEHSGIDGEYIVRIPLPLNIKKQLVDEWSLITGTGNRLVILPRKFTVTNIIDEFLDEKEKKNSPEMFTVYSDLFEGFKIFFDKALPYVLLYRQEREQFDIVSAKIGEGFLSSEVYGGEHLCRLFVRIQRSLSNVVIDGTDMTSAIQKLTEFTKWLEKNKDRFIVIADYLTANETLDALKLKTAAELIPKEEKIAEIISPKIGRSKKSKIIEDPVVEKVEISSPCSSSGRPMRSQAGRNRFLE